MCNPYTGFRTFHTVLDDMPLITSNKKKIIAQKYITNSILLNLAIITINLNSNSCLFHSSVEIPSVKLINFLLICSQVSLLLITFGNVSEKILECNKNHRTNFKMRNL